MINNISFLQAPHMANKNKQVSFSSRKSIQEASMYGLSGADKALANYNLAFISFKGMSNDAKVVYHEARSVEDLLKFRPDWKPEKLRNKFKEQNPYEDFTIGKVPEAFGNKEIFEKFLSNIHQQIKNQPNQMFSRKYTFNDIEIEGKKFKVTTLSGGQTGKLALGVETAHGDKFVVKYHPEINSMGENLDGGDTVGVQALIDYYLTANDCEYAAKMYFYDDKYNASIYEWVEKDFDQSLVYDRLKRYQNPVPELQKYGIQFNDTMGRENIFVRKGKPVMVDSGHCTFYDSAKPKDYELCRDLPNMMQFNCFMQ